MVICVVINIKILSGAVMIYSIISFIYLTFLLYILFKFELNHCAYWKSLIIAYFAIISFVDYIFIYFYFYLLMSS